VEKSVRRGKKYASENVCDGSKVADFGAASLEGAVDSKICGGTHIHRSRSANFVDEYEKFQNTIPTSERCADLYCITDFEQERRGEDQEDLRNF
jgi:hypothetical protein